jgi:ATP-dependent Clp protease, protease subunit
MEIPKISKKFEIMNSADGKSADLYLYGSIGSGWYSDISAKNVKDKLSQIDADTINIHINSPGGDVFDSITIHNLLKNHKASIVIHIDGLAASGASVIAMAADKIIMPKNAMMMIHNAWTFAAGNAKALRKVADDLEKIDTAVTESYMGRFVGERAELERLLSDETFLTAEECNAFGFCDEIADELKEDPEEDLETELSAKDKILNKYKPRVVASQKTDPEEKTVPKVANAMYQFLSGLNTSK